MLFTRLIFFQRLSVTMETQKRKVETFTFLNRNCNRGAADDKSVIEDTGK